MSGGSNLTVSPYHPLMRTYLFLTPPKIIYGAGSADKIGLEAKLIGGSSAFLVTDKVIQEIGLAERIKKALVREGFRVTVFNEVEAEPSIETAEKASNAVRENEYDLVVGLGGGSCLDVAKTSSIMVKNPGEIKDYIGTGLVKKRGLPLILLPTTAGTGSEVSDCIVLIMSGSKIAINSRYALAEVAIIDPLLTMTMPPKVTAASGLDALSHAIESMLSVDSSPVTDALALEAIRLISTNLRVAWAHGENLEARSNMSLAATMAGLAMNAGIVLGHFIADTISVRYNLSHGVACAISLLYTMEYNLPACILKLAMIYEAIEGRIEGLTPTKKAFRAMGAVKRLMEEVNVPTRLKDVGVPKEALPELAQELMRSPCPYDPRKLTKEDAIKIYERMWEGKLLE